jgi:hypothetical protein
MNVSLRSLLWGALVLAWLAGSPALADEVVKKGVDVWTTVAGFAQTSFAKDPIPAGFFCAGSQPFTGKIVMQGAPLAMNPAHADLGPVDTVVSRLDDARFDEKGEATTRIQLLALSLKSIKPVETSCGLYDVTAGLDGEQPTTTMRILRTAPDGGRYEAPLALNVKLVFTPVDGDAKGRRELTRHIALGPGNASVWTLAKKPRYDGPIWIDTDGNGKPDLQVRGSNFIAGMAPGKGEVRFATYDTYDSPPTCPEGLCPKQSCHCNPEPETWDPWDPAPGCSEEHQHCVWVCVDPATAPPGEMFFCARVGAPMEF